MLLGLLGRLTIFGHTGIHFSDEILDSNGKHLSAAQFDNSQELGIDEVIHYDKRITHTKRYVDDRLRYA